MDLNTIEIQKTGLLFFDILNGYYHETGAAAKQKKKPMVDNAVRLMKAARKTGMPIFFAQGSHREDEGTTVLLRTDTNIPLKPWPNGIVTMVKPAAIERKSGSEVIPELEPNGSDYHIPKTSLERFLPNLSRPRAGRAEDRYPHHIRRLNRRRRGGDGVCRQRHGLPHDRRPRRVRDQPHPART